MTEDGVSPVCQRKVRNALIHHHGVIRIGRGRRGSVYLLVLSTTLVIATLIGGTVMAQSAKLRSMRVAEAASQARFTAESGIEVARAMIKADANWRTNRASGRWASDLLMGTAKVDIDVVDTLDGDLANHPYQPVRITATARIGEAEQIVTATLVAKPNPIDALAYALHTGGQLHNGSTLQLGTATASTNGALQNDGTIEGNVFAGSIAKAGIIYGTKTTSSSLRAMPDPAAIDRLIALGTSIYKDKINAVTLSASVNPYGATNARGIYVARPGDDFELKETNINGTLIVICPSGKTVTIKGPVNLTSTSPDQPALVVRGNLNCDDTPIVINGLAHATGKFTTKKGFTINGLLIVESAASSNAVDLQADSVIKYTSSLYRTPPLGYAESIEMVLEAGSVQRVVR